MERTKSVAGLLRSIFVVLSAVVAVLFALLGILNLRGAIRTLGEADTRNLSDYSASFSMALDALQDANRRVATNPYFEYLAVGLSDSDKVLPLYHLRQILEYQTPYYAASFMYDTLDTSCDYVLGQYFHAGTSSVDERGLFWELCSLIDEKGAELVNRWFVHEKYGQVFLVIVSQNHTMFLCSVINLNIYVENNPIPATASAQAAFLFDRSGVLLEQPLNGEGTSCAEENLSALYEKGAGILGGKLINSAALGNTSLRAGIANSLDLIFSNILVQMSPLLAGLLLSAFAILLAYLICKRILVFPLRQIAAVSQRIQGDDPPAPEAAPRFNPVEFHQIKVSLNSLIEQVHSLEEEKRIKETEKEKALLQYYQLQARSHFLLNCLKSLYSAADENNPEKLKMMIISISNHLRYIFHDGVSLVPLRLELQEVNDYKNTVQGSYVHPLIVIQDIPEELLDCLVPPLILQTFFENAVKYSDKPAFDSLTVRIRISRVDYDGSPFLQIHISDNGVGYSAKTLEKLNADPTGSFDEQNIGINNLKRRISILFNGNYHAAFYNLLNGGACSILFIPLVKE